jgi:DNA-binding NtrC family response regulator
MSLGPKAALTAKNGVIFKEVCMSRISEKKPVLLVDNYPPHLKLFAIFLSEQKIGEILTAGSFDEAKEIIDQRGNEISLLITDYQLGGKNGGDLILYMKERHKKVKTILITIHQYAKELAQKYGADGYADKQYLEEGLRGVLKSLGFLDG